jgi:hypothetical protein
MRVEALEAEARRTAETGSRDELVDIARDAAGSAELGSTLEQYGSELDAALAELDDLGGGGRAAT